MSHRLFVSLGGFALFAALAAAGCNSSESSAPGAGAEKPANKKLRLAVIPKGESHEFWKSVHAGAEQAAREAGNVEILWKGPLLEHDRDGQISVVEDFVTKQVDGICLAPLDSRSLIAPVRNAKADGHVTGIVLQDPIKMGYLAVKTLVDHLHDKPVEKRIPTGEFVATAENMHEPEMDKLLHPEQFGQ